MKFKKISSLAFLSIFFVANASAKDLASESEVICYSFYKYVLSFTKEKYGDEIAADRDNLGIIMTWANKADQYAKMATDKYINKIGVSKDALNSAVSRRIDAEGNSIMSRFSNEADLNINALIKYGLDREKKLKCKR